MNNIKYWKNLPNLEPQNNIHVLTKCMRGCMVELAYFDKHTTNIRFHSGHYTFIILIERYVRSMRYNVSFDSGGCIML